jgi:hypothetical protein
VARRVVGSVQSVVSRDKDLVDGEVVTSGAAHPPDGPGIDDFHILGRDEHHRPHSGYFSLQCIARHKPAGMRARAAELPPTGNDVTTVCGSRDPCGHTCASDDADRIRAKHGPSHLSRDPATDDRVHRSAHARNPADRPIDGGELLDDLHPSRPIPFFTAGADRDQRTEEAESCHRFYHRWRQLARLVCALAVPEDELPQLACAAEFLLGPHCGRGYLRIGHDLLLIQFAMLLSSLTL